MLCEEYPNTQQDIVELMLPYLRKHKSTKGSFSQ